MNEGFRKIVLAYSGGLEATASIPWLMERYGGEVVTLTLDLGQALDLADIRERALAAGALRAHVLDAREEFVRGYVLPALHAGAFSPDREFAGIDISRPLVGRRLVEMARMESAGAVAHGFACDAAGRRGFETVLNDADPSLVILAPRCEWGMSRDDLVDYARARNLAIAPATSHHDVEANVWGRVIRGSIGTGAYQLTRPIPDSPDTPAFLDIEFERGAPIRTNGVEMPLIEMIESIETIAGAHGVGRIAGPDGAAAESPAAVVLHTACAELPATDGAVRVRLFKGSCEATALQTVA
jgi:argininosuccinate synthase